MYISLLIPYKLIGTTMQGMEKYDPKKVYERARNALKTGSHRLIQAATT